MYGSFSTSEENDKDPSDNNDDSGTPGVSALEELEALLADSSKKNNALLKETGSEINTSNLNEPTTLADNSSKEDKLRLSNEVDEYLASITAEFENDSGDDTNDIELTESDVVEYESSDLPEAPAKQIAYKKTAEETDEDVKEPPSIAHKNRLEKKYSDHEPDLADKDNQHQGSTSVSVFLIVMVVISVLIFWNLFDDEGTRNIIIEDAARSESVLKITPTKEITAEVDKINDLLVSLKLSSYEQELFDKKWDSEPVQMLLNETLSVEENNLSNIVETAKIVSPAQPVIALPVEASDVWLIHLLSFYNKPPTASELKPLQDLGIAYEVEKAMVKGETWYRLQVYKHSDFRTAKEYAAMLGNKFGIKGIWISKSKNNVE